METSYGRQVPRIEERKLGDLSIPTYKHDKDETPLGIANILHREFEVRAWQFHRLFEFDVEAEEMSTRELAERVTRAILRRPSVPRDEATIEYIGERCRDALEPYMTGYLDLNPQIPRSAHTRLLSFIHSDEAALPDGSITLAHILAGVSSASGD